jgi:hypothetical protein
MKKPGVESDAADEAEEDAAAEEAEEDAAPEEAEEDAAAEDATGLFRSEPSPTGDESAEEAEADAEVVVGVSSIAPTSPRVARTKVGSP